MPAEPPSPPPPSTPLAEESPRILAVDDDAVSRRILVRTLEHFEFDVVEAEAALPALAALEGERPPRIVITDWAMPDIDGVELCRRIRKRAPQAYVYIIVLTSRTEKTDLAEAFAAGADEFLTKPFDRLELRARLVAATRILSLERRLANRVCELERTLALLREREAQLVEAERLAAIGQVGITVRHEVNNPLTGIIGLADLALADRAALPPEAAKAFETIGALARRISATIARIEAPRSTRTRDYLAGEQMLDLGPS